MTLRGLILGTGNPTLKVMEKLANYFDCKLRISFEPKTDCPTEMSTAAVSMRVAAGESWKIAFFDLVDAFRKNQDYRLVMLRPTKKLDPRLKALLASIVCELCKETKLTPPPWAMQVQFQENPWFVSGMESLKASALQESPLSFRKNNIFVLKNFLNRA
ncbi:MAG: hypothetical protein AUJ52_10115 [Elusimicrobia bacterium CG1_02_63_36]|nr:MAG: hypothetical protein AUJ52_10115 [Elusimicrobia bacterium CG1_02_63_36]